MSTTTAPRPFAKLTDEQRTRAVALSRYIATQTHRRIIGSDKARTMSRELRADGKLVHAFLCDNVQGLRSTFADDVDAVVAATERHASIIDEFIQS